MVEVSDAYTRFVAALVKEQQKHAGEIGLRQRRETAERLGVDLAALEAEARALYEEGRRLTEERDWDAAVDCLFDAASVLPRDADVVMALTLAIRGRFTRARSDPDRELAMRLARRVVELDPERREAAEAIIEEMENTPARRGSFVPKPARMFIIVATLVLMFLMIILSALAYMQ